MSRKKYMCWGYPRTITLNFFRFFEVVLDGFKNKKPIFGLFFGSFHAKGIQFSRSGHQIGLKIYTLILNEKKIISPKVGTPNNSISQVQCTLEKLPYFCNADASFLWFAILKAQFALKNYPKRHFRCKISRRIQPSEQNFPKSRGKFGKLENVTSNFKKSFLKNIIFF